MAFNKLIYLTNDNTHQTFQNILRTESDHNSFLKQPEFKLAKYDKRPVTSLTAKKNTSNLQADGKIGEKKHGYGNKHLQGTFDYNDNNKPVRHINLSVI